MNSTSFEQRHALGCIIAAKRSAQNLTQEKLEAKSGVPLRTIQRAERGEGIGKENLEALAGSLGTTGASLLSTAAAQKNNSPELRLKLPEITTASDLVRTMRETRGTIHIGPEGEDAFNEHIGGPLLELTSMELRRARTEARYILQFAHKMGFRIFACSHREKIEHEGEVIYNPTRLVIAAPDADPRIRRTAKGPVLDYVADARKQVLHSMLKRRPTAFDWMEEQLLTRSDGEDRVRYVLRQLHEEVRKEMTSKPKKRRHRST